MLDFNETWDYLSNVIYNEKSGDGKEIGINIKFDSFDWGDKYYNESGELFIIDMFGSRYELGYNYITEDGEDWAQAECHQSFWCTENGKHIKCDELLEKVKNFQQLNREDKLGRILD